jgi:hypothetical protein
MGNAIVKGKEKCNKLEIYVKTNRNIFEVIYKYNNILEPYSGNLDYKHDTLEMSAVCRAIEHIEYLPFIFEQIICYIKFHEKYKFENIIFKEYI